MIRTLRFVANSGAMPLLRRLALGGVFLVAMLVLTLGLVATSCHVRMQGPEGGDFFGDRGANPPPMPRSEDFDHWANHIPLFAIVAVGMFLAFWPLRALGRVVPGPALLTGAGVLAFLPLASGALYATALAYGWWKGGDRNGALLALVGAGACGGLLVLASVLRHRLSREPRALAGERLSTPRSPGWHTDPFGANAYRYHDGASWTEHVSDGHTQRIDPLPVAAPVGTPTSSGTGTAKILLGFAFAAMGLVGAVLIASGLLGAWMRLRHQAGAEAVVHALAGRPVKTVAADAPDPGDDGRLVHVAGVARAAAPIGDPRFGVEADALLLERRVTMYQWIESCRLHRDLVVATGRDEHVEMIVKAPTRTRRRRGQVVQWEKCSYRKAWSAELESIKPERAAKYANPHAPLPLGVERFQPGSWKVGTLSFDRALLPEVAASSLAPFALSHAHASHLPRPLQSGARIDGAAIHIGDPSAPRVGDIRLEYLQRPAMAVSIVGEQATPTVKPHALDGGARVFEIREGSFSAEQMAGIRRSQAADGWGGHVGFVGIVFLGALLVFWPVRAIGRAIPGPRLLTGGGVLLFVPLATAALYGGALAWSWRAGHRDAALMAASVAAGSALLLLMAGAVRSLLTPR
jgi:hypothetical protein